MNPTGSNHLYKGYMKEKSTKVKKISNMKKGVRAIYSSLNSTLGDIRVMTRIISLLLHCFTPRLEYWKKGMSCCDFTLFL